MEASYKYQHKWFFLILIAFASAFNYYLTYSNIQLNSFLVFTYILDTIEGWLAWWALHTIIVYLDKKIPYSQSIVKRIVIQVITTTVAGLFVIIFLTEVISWIIRGRPALTNFYTTDIFIITIWFLVLNGIYIAIHFYNELQKSEQLRQQDKKLKSSGFYVKQGKQDFQVPFDEILAFYSDNGFTYLLTKQEKTFISDKSLDKIESSLPEEIFFRLNRKYILSRKAIVGFKRGEDGKLEVNVGPYGNLPGTVTVSRLRAIDFKKWFKLEES